MSKHIMFNSYPVLSISPVGYKSFVEKEKRQFRAAINEAQWKRKIIKIVQLLQFSEIAN